MRCMRISCKCSQGVIIFLFQFVTEFPQTAIDGDFVYLAKSDGEWSN